MIEQIVELIIFGLKCLIFCIMFFSVGYLFSVSYDKIDKIDEIKEAKKYLKK